jgi:hypothetical protein
VIDLQPWDDMPVLPNRFSRRKKVKEEKKVKSQFLMHLIATAAMNYPLFREMSPPLRLLHADVIQHGFDRSLAYNGRFDFNPPCWFALDHMPLCLHASL